jgi:hypothetical protein
MLNFHALIAVAKDARFATFLADAPLIDKLWRAGVWERKVTKLRFK